MSVNERIECAAKQNGFAEVFFVEYNKSDDYDCIAVLVYAYEPFPEKEYVSAYYIASNKSFHAMKELVAQLNAEGIQAENIYIPIKQFMQEKGLGLMGKNSLLHMEKYGSRVVLYSIGVKGASPMEYAIVPQDICKGCTRCMQACPGHAITEMGYERTRCIRHYMDEPPYPDFVQKSIKTYLGCEECMRVCPYNAHIKTTELPRVIKDALSPERILQGDVKAAKGLFGRNIKTKRLLADAEAILKSK